MRTNRGKTSLKVRRRKSTAMQDYDRLPPELRAWLASAIMPWSPRSVQRAFDRAMARTQDKTLALRQLDQLQRRRIMRDARVVWGTDHPMAAGEAG